MSLPVWLLGPTFLLGSLSSGSLSKGVTVNQKKCVVCTLLQCFLLIFKIHGNLKTHSNLVQEQGIYACRDSHS